MEKKQVAINALIALALVWSFLSQWSLENRIHKLEISDASNVQLWDAQADLNDKLGNNIEGLQKFATKVSNILTH